MYAVIKTGGKQYRVQPGDVLVVEKLEGDVGAEIAFNEVLMLGDDGATHLGAPLLDGAVVRATLIETRKGDKVTTIKKIRRQGYRRTKGHRQQETVLRVIGLEGAGLEAKWDGEVDMMTRADMRLRARNLAPRVDAEAPKAAKSAKKAAVPKVSAEKVVDANIVDEQAAAETKAPVKTEAKAKAAPAPKAEPKTEAAPVKAKAAPTPKAEAKTETKPAAKAKAEPKTEAKPAAKAKAPAKAAAADGETKKAPAKKPAAKAAPKSKS